MRRLGFVHLALGAAFLGTLAGCHSGGQERAHPGTAAGAATRAGDTITTPSSPPQSSDTQTSTGATGTGATGHSTMCDGFEVGKDKVKFLYCDGPATAEETVGKKTWNLTGGTCESDENAIGASFGVVSIGEPSLSTSEYFGVTYDSTDGPHGYAYVTYRLDGVNDFAGDNNPVIAPDRSTMTARGKSLRDQQVSAVVTCN